MPLKKEATKITEANGGIHNQKAYVKMKYMITSNTYSKPRLYHLILMGTEMSGEYQSALKALCVELRRKKVECRWKAALESEKTKGLHMHVFILTNAEYYNPTSILKGNSWIRTMLAKRSLRYHLAPPKAPIHKNRKGKQLRYATLATQEKNR